MSILDNSGATMLVGSQAVIHGTTYLFTSYFAPTGKDGDLRVDDEEIEDADGKLAAILTYKRHKTWSGELMCKSDAVPLTDFPKGDFAAIASLSGSGWYVRNMSVAKSKSAAKVSVDLELLPFTT